MKKIIIDLLGSDLGIDEMLEGFLLAYKEIKDSVVLKCVQNFGAGMVTSCTNPATSWLQSKIKNYDLSTDDASREWCDIINTFFHRLSGIPDRKGRTIYD